MPWEGPEMFTNKMMMVGLLISAHVAFAGGDVGNGGGGVFCEGKSPVLLDYYEAGLKRIGQPTAPALVDLDKLTEKAAFELFQSRLASVPEFKEQVDRAMKIVGDVANWIDGPVVEVDDTGKAYHLPAKCAYSQIAVRQEKQIYADSALLSRLSEGQRTLLRFHEAIYYLMSLRNKHTSIEVRKVTAALVRAEFSPSELKQALAPFGFACAEATDEVIRIDAVPGIPINVEATSSSIEASEIRVFSGEYSKYKDVSTGEASSLYPIKSSMSAYVSDGYTVYFGSSGVRVAPVFKNTYYRPAPAFTDRLAVYQNGWLLGCQERSGAIPQCQSGSVTSACRKQIFFQVKVQK